MGTRRGGAGGRETPTRLPHPAPGGGGGWGTLRRPLPKPEPARKPPNQPPPPPRHSKMKLQKWGRSTLGEPFGFSLRFPPSLLCHRVSYSWRRAWTAANSRSSGISFCLLLGGAPSFGFCESGRKRGLSRSGLKSRSPPGLRSWARTARLARRGRRERLGLGAGRGGGRPSGTQWKPRPLLPSVRPVHSSWGRCCCPILPHPEVSSQALETKKGTVTFLVHTSAPLPS